MSSSWVNHSHHHDREADAPSFTPGSIVTMAIYSLTFLLGLPGNALVIWVTSLKMKRTVNTVWFLNLAVADFLCCLSLPFSIAHQAMNGHWPYGNFLCKVLPAVIIFNMFASVFILVAISVDRCLLVIKPVWCQNHRKVGLALGLCLCIWFLAFLMCVPVFLYRQTILIDHDHIACGYNYIGSDLDFDLDYSSFQDYNNYYPMDTHQTTDRDLLYDPTRISDLLSEISVGMDVLTRSSDLNESSDRLLLGTVQSIQSYSSEQPSNVFAPVKPSKPFFKVESTIPPGGTSTEFTQVSPLIPHTVTTITRLIFGFVVPLAVILVCYAFILCRVRGAHFSKSSGKMLRVVFSIVSAFFICWAPYHLMGVILLYSSSPTLIHLDNLSQGLAYINSCVNPVLYVFTGQDFKVRMRKSLHAIFESAFSEQVTRSTAPTMTKNSTDEQVNVTAV